MTRLLGAVIDWRLVGDFIFRNTLFVLIFGPVGFLAGFFGLHLFFLPFALISVVGISIDEFYRLRPHRVIRSLGVSEGTVLRTVWFLNVILPAAFVGLVHWAGVVAESRIIQIGWEHYPITWITVLWIFHFSIDFASYFVCLVIANL